MSKDNVELARRYYETFNVSGLDGTQPLRHPEIEAFDPPNFPDADRYVGEHQVRRLVQGYLDLGWDGQFHEPEYIEAGDEVVVVWQLRGLTAHGGGFPVEAPLAHVCLFEEGKLRRLRQYWSRQEGLEAAGLAE